MAATLLTRSSASIKKIAEQVGYGSDEAFSRAFKQWSGGAPPGAYRRDGRSSPGQR